eukprot:3196527-Pyramimonas_sp.AAC.1
MCAAGACGRCLLGLGRAPPGGHGTCEGCTEISAAGTCGSCLFGPSVETLMGATQRMRGVPTWAQRAHASAAFWACGGVP